MTQKNPSMIKVIQMYRRDFNLTYEEAVKRAITDFDKRGWIVPDSFRGIHALHGRRAGGAA